MFNKLNFNFPLLKTLKKQIEFIKKVDSPKEMKRFENFFDVLIEIFDTTLSTITNLVVRFYDGEGVNPRKIFDSLPDYDYSSGNTIQSIDNEKSNNQYNMDEHLRRFRSKRRGRK